MDQCAKMRLLLSCLLLASLCALSSWSTPVVTQSPDASVMEGETANITCCWTVRDERIAVNWLKNQTQIRSEIFQKKSPPESLQETSNCTHLTIPSIRREDSGRYICRLSVEIPVLTVFEGNGTVITVEARENTTDSITEGGQPPPNIHSPISLVISLAVVALLLIILAWFYKLLRRRALAARVIYEVPHIDSEAADVDKHSTSSSRGSSQWCQVPVYESFDYFERVQTKESG